MHRLEKECQYNIFHMTQLYYFISPVSICILSQCLMLLYNTNPLSRFVGWVYVKFHVCVYVVVVLFFHAEVECWCQVFMPIVVVATGDHMIEPYSNIGLVIALYIASSLLVFDRGEDFEHGYSFEYFACYIGDVSVIYEFRVEDEN